MNLSIQNLSNQIQTIFASKIKPSCEKIISKAVQIFSDSYKCLAPWHTELLSLAFTAVTSLSKDMGIVFGLFSLAIVIGDLAGRVFSLQA